jgi:RND family efflux transporter MFP subunit
MGTAKDWTIRACAILGAAAPLLLATGCTHSPASSEASAAETGADAPRTAKPVHIVEARLEPWPITVRVQGSLLADEEAVIGSKLAGRIDAVEVDLGAVVKQGETLVTLDRRELELLVRQAEAQLKQACSAIGLEPEADETKRVLEDSPLVRLESALVDEARAAVDRANRLRPTKAITDAEYETFMAQLKTAEARYQSALNAVREQIALIGVRRADLALVKQRLDDSQVTAPFDAQVSARMVSPGAYVQMGQAVTELVRIDCLRFTAGVPERRAGRIAVGQPIEINLAGRDEPIMASICRLSPMVAQSSRSLRIEADVPNDDLSLQAGLFAEAEITVDSEAQTLAAPLTAVSQFAGVQKVWVVRDGVASQTTVRTGRRDDERVEILEGIAPGTTIVAVASEGHEGPVTPIAEPAGT